MNKSCYVIFTSLILDLLGFTIILPLLPSILDYYQQQDQSGYYDWLNVKVNSLRLTLSAPNEHNKVLFAGLIGSWFSLLQFLSSPFIGALSDTHGRRAIMLICLIGSLFSYILWMFSQNSFLLFFLSRTIAGISKGNISLSTAIMTDICSISDRTKGMALIGISFSIGFIFGPLIGAYFSHLSKDSINLVSSNNPFLLPASFAAFLTFLNILFIFYQFEESLPKEKRLASIGYGLARAVDFVNPISLFKFKTLQNTSAKDIKDLKDFGLVYFLFLFLYSGLEYNLPFLTHERFSFTRIEQAKMFLFNGIIMTIVQGGYVRRISTGKELKTVVQGLLLIIPAFIFIGLASTTIYLYSALVLYAFSSATVVPCLTTLASSVGRADQKGTIMGTFRSLGSLARAFGPLVSSFAFWRFGAAVAFYCGALLLVIPFCLSISIKGRLAKIKDK